MDRHSRRTNDGHVPLTRRIRNGLIVGLLFLMVLIWADYALAQSACMPPEMMEDILLRQYGETPFAQGTQRDGGVVVFYGSRRGGSWTVVLVGPDGCARIVSSGGTFTAPLAG